MVMIMVDNWLHMSFSRVVWSETNAIFGHKKKGRFKKESGI